MRRFLRSRRSHSVPSSRLGLGKEPTDFAAESSIDSEKVSKHELGSPRSTQTGGSDSDVVNSWPSEDSEEDVGGAALRESLVGLSTPHDHDLPVYSFAMPYPEIESTWVDPMMCMGTQISFAIEQYPQQIPAQFPQQQLGFECPTWYPELASAVVPSAYTPETYELLEAPASSVQGPRLILSLADALGDISDNAEEPEQACQPFAEMHALAEETEFCCTQWCQSEAANACWSDFAVEESSSDDIFDNWALISDQQQTIESGRAIESDAQEASALQLPSAGSAGHHVGNCEPCAFFHAGRCGNATSCRFCHLCDPAERKRRRRAKHHAKMETPSWRHK